MRGVIASVFDVVGLLVVIVALVAMLLVGRNAFGWQPVGVLFAEAGIYSRLLLFITGVSVILGLFQSWLRARAVSGRGRLPAGDIRRHTVDSIFVHWTNTVGFVACGYSGLVLLKWIGNTMSLPNIYQLHYLGAALMLIALVSYVVHHQVTGDTGLLPRKGDLRGALTELAEYLDVVGEGQRTALGLRLPSVIRRPLNALAKGLGLSEVLQPGKYLPTEKALSFFPWAVLMALVVLSGMVKLAKYAFAVPSDLLRWSTLVHDAIVPLLIAAVVVHVLALILVPANFALLRSMFTGKVPGHYVKKHHPVWYAELEQAPEPQEIEIERVRKAAI